MTNKVLQEKLKEYPDDVIVCVEPTLITYNVVEDTYLDGSYLILAQ